MIMEGDQGLPIREIRDGTSNTIALVEVNDEQAVIWTKPDDYEWNQRSYETDLWGRHPAIFNAGFADGHVTAISQSIDPVLLKAMFTRSGGEVVQLP